MVGSGSNRGSGWSMGGGGAQLAAVEDPTLRAVVALYPWEPKSSTIADFE